MNPELVTKTAGESLERISQGFGKKLTYELICSYDFGAFKLPEYTAELSQRIAPFMETLLILMAEIEFDSFAKIVSSEYERLSGKEEWIDKPEGAVLFFLIQLLIHQKVADEGDLGLRRELVHAILDSIKEDELYLEFFSTLFHHPEWAGPFHEKMCQLRSIETYDNGRSKNSWEQFTQNILTRVSKMKYYQHSTFGKEYSRVVQYARARMINSKPAAWFKEIKKEGWKVDEWVGRTLLFNRKDSECEAGITIKSLII
ncbi:hypothetical protein SCG7109_AC_00040 [Chlamydiales bacterium SCGC AG-110-M15]|nr:hypothetical protein SCG7109_AC_00040 [Chlamydiales bacterium SCGC AG-110-M15]